MNLRLRIYNKRNFIYSYYTRKGGIFDKNLFAKLVLHVTSNIFVDIFNTLYTFAFYPTTN